jgi:uncharacterized damage-inducible protein DinB
MTEIDRLDRVLMMSWNGDAWYGPPAAMILEGISATRAAERVLPGAHTIHELVFHVAAWLDEVCSLLGGAPPNFTKGFDWPEPGPVSDEDWQGAKAGLAEAHRRLSGTLADLPPARLDEVVGPDREPSEGTGLTVHEVLVGLAQHGAYHLGQIALLAKQNSV